MGFRTPSMDASLGAPKFRVGHVAFGALGVGLVKASRDQERHSSAHIFRGSEAENSTVNVALSVKWRLAFGSITARIRPAGIGDCNGSGNGQIGRA